MIREAIAKIVGGKDLREAEMLAVMTEVMEGTATPAQVAAFMTALRIKGETVEEVTGAARIMRQKATRIDARSSVVVDTCGTGGDGRNTFNISTTAAFVVAAAGLTVAKHGNRAVSSGCASADRSKYACARSAKRGRSCCCRRKCPCSCRIYCKVPHGWDVLPSCQSGVAQLRQCWRHRYGGPNPLHH